MNSNPIYKIGTAIALLFMVLELSYINAKSLLYIVDSFGTIDRIFAVIGSMAFSMVTILVMRRSSSRWMKVIFPVFDSFLVFCGFNLKFADNLTGNPIAFGLTIFMAVFTGLIMYSLGAINYQDRKSEVNSDEGVIISLQSEIGKIQTEINSLATEINEKQTEINILKTEKNSLKSQIEFSQSEIRSLQTESEKYKTGYLQAERSRILKKKPDNRTHEEICLLTEMELTPKGNV